MTQTKELRIGSYALLDIDSKKDKLFDARCGVCIKLPEGSEQFARFVLCDQKGYGINDSFVSSSGVLHPRFTPRQATVRLEKVKVLVVENVAYPVVSPNRVPAGNFIQFVPFVVEYDIADQGLFAVSTTLQLPTLKDSIVWGASAYDLQDLLNLQARRQVEKKEIVWHSAKVVAPAKVM
jgi:hypothetical protein